jgi:hypothetical protein
MLTVFERFEVVEIEATDGTALGIGVEVTDHEAVTSMVARIGVGSMSWSRMRVAVGWPMDTKASTFDHRVERLEGLLLAEP